MLITEDGSNVAGAESYISVVDADLYFSNRGNATWDAFTTDQKEQYLRKSTDFMMQRYKLYWKGFQKYSTQTTDWPRTFVYSIPVLYGDSNLPYPQLISSTIVPIEVQRACAELALRSSSATLMPDTKTRQKRKTVGPITIEYDIYSPQNPVYKSIDAMLAPYLKDGGMESSSSTVQRA